MHALHPDGFAQVRTRRNRRVDPATTWSDPRWTQVPEEGLVDLLDFAHGWPPADVAAPQDVRERLRADLRHRLTALADKKPLPSTDGADRITGLWPDATVEFREVVAAFDLMITILAESRVSGLSLCRCGCGTFYFDHGYGRPRRYFDEHTPTRDITSYMRNYRRVEREQRDGSLRSAGRK